MPSRADLHHYQELTAGFICDNPAAFLIQGMGLGKTISTLTGLSDLFDQFMIGRVLVIAPLRVAESTWPAELRKWSHVSHLTMSLALGDEKVRRRAIKSKSQICVINRENVPWLVDNYRNVWPFDTVVIDESSSFKSIDAKRFKMLKTIRPKISRVALLTGTPTPNSLLELWPQAYLLDMGKSLGPTFTGFRDAYFTTDYGGYKWEARPGAKKSIEERIAHLCLTMRVEDYMELPGRIDIPVMLEMDADTKAVYRQMEKKMLAEVDDGEVTALSAGVLCGKLQQLAQGAVYDEARIVRHLHDLKLDMLEELVEAAGNDNILVFYNYKHDAARIKSRFPKVVEVREKGAIDAWNAGKIRLLMAHPASAGHGLNLQHGGHRIVWFSQTWSSELLEQANARLHRQGQSMPVTVHSLIVRDTIDEDIHRAVKGKVKQQDAFIAAIKRRKNIP